MPATTFDRFDGGYDRRKGKGTSDANRLFQLVNAYVTTGWQIRKRPGLNLIANLQAGTIGLHGALGQLQTFYSGNGSAPIIHADPLFHANRVAHPAGAASPILRVNDLQVFNRAIYVSIAYAGAAPNFFGFHYYLEKRNTLPSRGVSTAYVIGDEVIPASTPDNGFFYRATTNGTTSGGGDPTWPLTALGTVADGTVTWEAHAGEIEDVNCPHGVSVVKLEEKIFTEDPADDADTVHFSATGAPRDWTSGGDAGFLPTGQKAEGETKPRGLGRYRERLSVLHRDSIQTWNVDPDPALHDLDKIIDAGTLYPLSAGNVSQDLYLLSDFGFRSISTIELSGSLQDLDVGNPIDELVEADLALTTDPIAIFWHGGGQYWCRMYGGVVWVFTYSRVSKVFAWSRYEFPVTIDAIAELNNLLYVRAGDLVYRVDKPEDGGNDGGLVTALVQLDYQDFGKPGQLKQFIGFDIVQDGRSDVSFSVTPNDPSGASFGTAIETIGDTRAGGMLPIGMMGTELGIKIQSDTISEAWLLKQITIYYDVLGAV